MSKTELKPGIFVEGFENTATYIGAKIHTFVDGEGQLRDNFIWGGITSEIPEDLAKSCLPKKWKGKYLSFNEWRGKYQMYGCTTAVESIQLVCRQKYCIIYKEY